eukprot:scaffold31961_cov32-Tisochrysis_lutea.AAC.1
MIVCSGGRKGRELLRGSHHTILHKPTREGAMHDLEAPSVTDGLPPDMWAAEDGPRIPHAHPERVTPRWDGRGAPVVGLDLEAHVNEGE